MSTTEEKLLRSVGVPDDFLNASPTDFSDPVRQRVRDDWQQAQWFLTGDCGLGKTHLAVAILRKLMQQGNVCHGGSVWRDGRWKPAKLFYVVPDMLGEMQSMYTFNQNVDGFVSALQHQPLLVLDDLGAEKPSDWTYLSLYRIIAYREANHKSLIVTSNFSLAEINKNDPRIASRLERFAGIELVGTSKRRKR